MHRKITEYVGMLLRGYLIIRVIIHPLNPLCNRRLKTYQVLTLWIEKLWSDRKKVVPPYVLENWVLNHNYTETIFYLLVKHLYATCRKQPKLLLSFTQTILDLLSISTIFITKSRFLGLSPNKKRVTCSCVF